MSMRVYVHMCVYVFFVSTKLLPPKALVPLYKHPKHTGIDAASQCEKLENP